MRLATCGRTAVGKVRHNNEDNLWCGAVGDGSACPGERETGGAVQWPGFLLAVADGMGGEAGGEVASRMAVEGLAAELSERVRQDKARERGAATVGTEAVHAANDRIRERAEHDASLEKMGTTLTVAWLVDGRVEVFHVGDSRAYLWRGGRLEQLTKDQTYVAKLVEEGLLTPELAESAVGKHIILQALGSETPLEVEHRSVPLQPGDVLLLCTDGLSGQVKHGLLETVLRRGGTLADQAQRLVQLSEEAGGHDNVTVVLARTSAG